MAALRLLKYDSGYISPNETDLGSPIVNLPGGRRFDVHDFRNAVELALRHIFVQSPNEEERIEFEQALLLAGLPP